MLVDITCDECGKELKREKHDAQRYKHTYCSLTCSWLSQKKWRTPHIADLTYQKNRYHADQKYRERKLAQQKAYRQANLERVRARWRREYQRDKEAILARRKKRRAQEKLSTPPSS